MARRSDDKQAAPDAKQPAEGRRPDEHAAPGTPAADEETYGGARGDGAGADRGLEEVEREDPDLLAGGRKDAERKGR
jgi:hypothetical protein